MEAGLNLFIHCLDSEPLSSRVLIGHLTCERLGCKAVTINYTPSADCLSFRGFGIYSCDLYLIRTISDLI
ncbi:hypothetical protein J6590_068838 [Homalodisca vitripennis]|nr:hypothetical protein J6590_068838 [Homalodisca vitripennis]